MNVWRPWTSLQRPLRLTIVGIAGGIALACMLCAVSGVVLWQAGLRPGEHRYTFVGPSMEPTIHDGQVLVAQDYGSAQPQRGDIVVFHSPKISEITLPDLLVKRIIAVPRDTIAFTDTTVIVNGKPLVEPYVAPQNADYHDDSGDRPLTLQPQQYYVLGDNRGDSVDSLLFGPIDRSTIIAKVVSIT